MRLAPQRDTHPDGNYLFLTGFPVCSSLSAFVTRPVCADETCARGFFNAFAVLVFRSSATKSGWPFGVMSASSWWSCKTPLFRLTPPPRWANLPLAQHNIVTWQYHVVTWRLGALGPYADQAYLLTPEDFSIHLQFEGFLRWGLQWWQLNANFLLSESRIFLDRLMACLNLTSQTKLGLFVVPISVNLHPALQILQTLNLSRPFSTLGSALSVSA